MKRQHGFGLIEVMLAFVIVAATAGTLLQLNKTYLEYSRDGRSREVAMRLAESKLDELRRFQSRNGFDEITDGSDTVNLDNNEYARNWAVTESGNAQKQVVVTINWNDGGEALSFTLGTTISLNISAISGSLGTANKHLGTGKGGPKVKHTPGLFPDVVAIDLGDGFKQETSKPVVTVAKNDSTSVRVSEKTTLYDAANIKVQEQDLVTVSCNCKLSGSADAELPAQRTMVGALAYWKNGDNALKQTGKAKDNKQDKLCNLCCKSHFDGPNNEFSHWYDVIKAKAGAHIHESTYKEACRMVRIDGFLKVVNDWNLVVLNVFRDDYLNNSDNLQYYQDYIKEVAVENLKNQVADLSNYSVPYTDPMSFKEYLEDRGLPAQDYYLAGATGHKAQLIARGIYVDMLSANYRQAVQDKMPQDTSLSNLIYEVLIRYAPFTERNLTELVEWKSQDEDQVMVSASGVVEIKASGEMTTVGIASIRRSNSGRTGAAITTAEESDRKTASITVTVVP